MTRKQLVAAQQAVADRRDETKRDILRYSASPSHPTVLALNSLYSVCILLSEALSAAIAVTPEDSTDA